MKELKDLKMVLFSELRTKCLKRQGSPLLSSHTGAVPGDHLFSWKCTHFLGFPGSPTGGSQDLRPPAEPHPPQPENCSRGHFIYLESSRFPVGACILLVVSELFLQIWAHNQRLAKVLPGFRDCYSPKKTLCAHTAGQAKQSASVPLARAVRAAEPTQPGAQCQAAAASQVRQQIRARPEVPSAGGGSKGPRVTVAVAAAAAAAVAARTRPRGLGDGTGVVTRKPEPRLARGGGWGGWGLRGGGSGGGGRPWRRVCLSRARSLEAGDREGGRAGEEGCGSAEAAATGTCRHHPCRRHRSLGLPGSTPPPPQRERSLRRDCPLRPCTSRFRTPVRTEHSGLLWGLPLRPRTSLPSRGGAASPGDAPNPLDFQPSTF
ncbi:uncharacterized protein LOC144582940 [Callithrix jacchus]